MPIRIFFRCSTAILVALCISASGRADASSVNWRTDLDAAMIEAARTNRLLLLHFWTAKCGPCVVLEQNVFSQPHVGAAIEQEYVPVKINADEKQALASQFRIDRVPTEIVMTSQGNVVATLSSPNQPDAYIAQLQNLARHFRQTTAAGPGGAQQAAVNPAYSNLPVSPAAPRPQYNEHVQNPAAAPGNAAAASSNPPASAATTTPVNQYGQAASVYAAQTPALPQTQLTATSQSPAATNANLVANTTTMPANAMPRSYRNPNTAEGAAASGTAAAVGVTNSAQSTPGGAAADVPIAPAASNSAAVAAAPSAAATGAVAPSSSTGFTGLPADAPPVAFDGCCPVTLKSLKKWTAGNPALGIVHRGRTYLFAGEAERNQFWADPDGYSPVFAGLDPVLLLESQQSVPGNRQYGYEYGGLFYLFSSKETMDRFAASPSTYAAGVRQAMSRIDASGADVLRR